MNSSDRIVFPGNPSLSGLVADDGTTFEDLRPKLAPRYGWVWADVAVRYALMFTGLAAAAAMGTGWSVAALASAPLFALWIGYWFASIVLFMHEGAHYNLHQDKSANDRLANTFVCWLVGDDVSTYRALHWQHHLHLGEIGDTEVSYHYAPTFRFLIETLIGLHALRVFRTHQSGVGQQNPHATRTARLSCLLRGMLVHAILLGALVVGGWYGAALAWVLAVVAVFPYLSALRQQLEHRALDARSEVDYSIVPHGAVNRMFRGSPLGRSFGSAGFRRHLLHHWYPSVSYSRYDELEEFLLRTKLRPLVDDARTSYLGAWRELAST